MKKLIQPKALQRPAPEAARFLLGKYLCRRINGRVIRKMITETEAYHGPSDRASHAFKGKTERNCVMFGEAGRFYVYFTYGMHWMLNIVTGEKDLPSAVLIRSLRRIEGPGRLTKALSIDKRFNGEIAGKKIGLWLEDRGEKIDAKYIKKGPRVGVLYAGPYWAGRHYRFYLDQAFLSEKPTPRKR